jgi:polyferredoxin
MLKQDLKRCKQCHEVKPLAEFPTTPTGVPDRRRRGHGEWCSTCVDAPDPTMSAGARRAQRLKAGER